MVRLQGESRLLFLYDVIGAMREPARRFAFWPSVCGKHHLWPPDRMMHADGAGMAARPVERNPPKSINAFLTLTAVTKW